MGKLKKAVLIGVIAVGIGGVGAGIVGLRAYDEATRIDRSHPDVVIGEFVDAYLHKRDDAAASLYTCGRRADLHEFSKLRDRIKSEEVEKGTTIQVVLGRSQTSQGGSHVATELQLRVGNGSLVVNRLQYWDFVMVEEDGWRVCGAEQLPDPSPTPSNAPTATPPTAG